jgi:TfoX/Sxy family transcriptional regulator of competence genes
MNMAYNEKLAQRVRKILAAHGTVIEKRMFGGLAFIIRGNMFCGVLNEDLIVRTGPEGYEEALAEPYVRSMDFTGRPVKSIVFVGPKGYLSDEGLNKWIQRGLELAQSLPPK